MSDENLLTADVETQKIDSKKPAHVPDKFWNAKKEEIRLEALLSSYLALEKKLSTMVAAEDTKRMQKVLGVPDSAKDYNISVPNDLFDIDEELNERLLQKGFTQEQVQEVYDLAAEKLVPLIVEMAAEFQADREVERLVDKFGGADQWKEISRQLLAFGKKNLPVDVLNGLSCSYEGVMALHRMMKAEQPNIKNSDTAQPSGEKDLYQMMKNPKYWRDKDPSFIAKVTEGFEKLYSTKR
ncbi:MAG: hypothetical protein DI586_02475 [Micavibrio aeruginosavorus]|uniref:Uncharacterized protein n=1 Tax=Micavibrio aeruginosavorus TaxID=349221 RepID=A0A2W5HT43_9BACT|nr:MAG: hypothetical protein DI586_02475 [Micavibrio aeruginosavorus]